MDRVEGNQEEEVKHTVTGTVGDCSHPWVKCCQVAIRDSCLAGVMVFARRIQPLSSSRPAGRESRDK